MHQHRLAVLAVAASLVSVTAAGCGGGGGANEQTINGQSYASDVCGIALAWDSASTTIHEHVAGKASGDNYQQQISDAQSQTGGFISTIRLLKKPEGEAQAQAYASLETTADSLEASSKAIRPQADALASGKPGQAAAAKEIDKQIQLIDGALRSSVKELDAIYPDANVPAIVRADQSCQFLGV